MSGMVVSAFNSMNRVLLNTHFTDEEAEPQKGHRTGR